METIHALVTGGAGFIGSHLVNELLLRGHKVTVIDDLSSGVSSAVPREASFFCTNIANEENVHAILQKSKFDVVFHFAGLIRVDESMIEPLKYLHKNVSDSLAFFKILEAHKLSKIVFSSTAAVYGTPLKTPIDESHPVHPINPYGLSKSIIESVLQELSVHSVFSYVALRYFNAAGAHPSNGLRENHQPETHLIPCLIDAIREGKKITVFGTNHPTPDGTCIRDYVHVMDLVEAHILAAGYLLKDNPSAIFNLGTGEGTSVLEVIDEIRKHTSYPIEIEKKPARLGDPPCLVASNTLAKSVLHWTPKRTLQHIIADTARSRFLDI